ncbi:MAG: hypothetical protein OEW04_13340, partial [Nitrospirota bacterium]|nr:hypothetical protein [Nitrospirota bacterium]
GKGVSCMVSIIMNLLFSLREVFYQAKSGILKKHYSPGCHKNGYVSPCEKRACGLYKGSPARRRECIH